MTRKIRETGNWFARYKELLIGISLATAVLVNTIKPMWTWLVWDVCAEGKTEAMIECTVGNKMDKLIEAVEYQTFVQIMTVDGKHLEQLETEWAKIKKAKGDK